MGRVIVTAFGGLCLALSLVACAGPTTPFGGLNGFGGKVQKMMGAVSLGESAHISFSPHRQLLHDQSTFEILIDDPRGIPESYHLNVAYNDLDVTSTFLKNSEETWLGPDRKQLKITLKNFRLPPDKEHDIWMAYRRDLFSFPVVATFEPPRCSFEPERKLASIPAFDPPALTIRTINKHAMNRKLNPYLVAGLIAQESSFDPDAVSSRKAIGLTQITSIVETELLKDEATWPRYPGLREMTALEVKLAVAKGEINASNEWRLNPEYSVQGGIAYLSYINDYWNKKTGQPPPLEVMLASYNSGPARVSRAIERGGTEWMNDEELTEGKKYVRRVVSFCDHFSHGGR